MASIDKRKGAWRVQVRRGRRSWNKTFRMKADGEAWARDIERAVDRDVDPLASRITTKDSFASLINRHMDDLATYGKPLRRSKEAVLRRLEAELGSETIADLTRDRLIQYGRDRVKAGAGPATLAIDISFILGAEVAVENPGAVAETAAKTFLGRREGDSVHFIDRRVDFAPPVAQARGLTALYMKAKDRGRAGTTTTVANVEFRFV